MIYLTVTKPDVTFAVGVLNRFMHQLKPKEVHWTTALRIFTYVKSSPEKGLLYKKHEHVRIFDYCDSSILVIREIENPMLAIAHLLEKIW